MHKVKPMLITTSVLFAALTQQTPAFGCP